MLKHWDERRDIEIGGDAAATVEFAVNHWIGLARNAIERRGRFAVALSGGSTPKAIFERLAKEGGALDWSRVFLFWSDERAVPPNHPDSNYHMAMSAGFGKVPVPPHHIFRMKAESEIEQSAKEYEAIIKREVGDGLFDLVMLGVGEDGHIASLFPDTAGLKAKDQLVVANYICQKKSWRMTFTFLCINQSRQAAIYALGESKQTIVPEVLKAKLPSQWPASYVGTKEQKALWILDIDASKYLDI